MKFAHAASPSPDREIVSTRLINVSCEAVFGAFADPKRLAQWWGPKGFTNTFKEFDLRPGGFWRFVMHGPDGADFSNESTFLEVVKPERIVFQHLEPIHRFETTMTFAAEDGQTRLTWRMLFESADECEKLRNFIADANEQNFDRLEAYLKDNI